MGKLIPQLISILTTSPKKRERHDFTMRDRDEVIRKQKGKCAMCGGHMNRWKRDFHHKDGNKSNNKLSNCRAVHTRCHRKKHAKQVGNKHHDPLLKLITGRWGV